MKTNIGPNTKHSGRLIKGHKHVVPGEANDVFWNYLKSLPPPAESPAEQAERAEWFIPWLEHNTKEIADDAYHELEALPYESLRELRTKLPREKLREWVSRSLRRDLYAICLGMCGNDSDVELLKTVVLDSADFRLGVKGAWFALVVLQGEKGLELIEKHKLRARTFVDSEGNEQKLPFFETWAAMEALRLLWKNEPELISRPRLCASMRILLARSEFSDLVVHSLTEWEDWSVQDRLMAMFDDEEFGIPATKRAIIRYMYRCSKSAAPNNKLTPPHVEAAERHLKLLQAKDAKLYRQVMRFIVK